MKLKDDDYKVCSCKVAMEIVEGYQRVPQLEADLADARKAMAATMNDVSTASTCGDNVSKNTQNIDMTAARSDVEESLRHELDGVRNTLRLVESERDTYERKLHQYEDVVHYSRKMVDEIDVDVPDDPNNCRMTFECDVATWALWSSAVESLPREE